MKLEALVLPRSAFKVTEGKVKSPQRTVVPLFWKPGIVPECPGGKHLKGLYLLG